MLIMPRSFPRVTYDQCVVPIGQEEGNLPRHDIDAEPSHSVYHSFWCPVPCPHRFSRLLQPSSALSALPTPNALHVIAVGGWVPC